MGIRRGRRGWLGGGSRRLQNGPRIVAGSRVLKMYLLPSLPTSCKHARDAPAITAQPASEPSSQPPTPHTHPPTIARDKSWYNVGGGYWRSPRLSFFHPYPQTPRTVKKKVAPSRATLPRRLSQATAQTVHLLYDRRAPL